MIVYSSKKGGFIIKNEGIYNVYAVLKKEREKLQDELIDLVVAWRRGESKYSTQEIEVMVNSLLTRIKGLEEKEKEAHGEFFEATKKAAMKHKAEVSLKKYLGESFPTMTNDEFSEQILSHITTVEQLEEIKARLLEKINERASKREISLVIAARLSQYVDMSYKSCLEEITKK